MQSYMPQGDGSRLFMSEPEFEKDGLEEQFIEAMTGHFEKGRHVEVRIGKRAKGCANMGQTKQFMDKYGGKGRS